MKTKRAVLMQPGRFEIEEKEVNPGKNQVLVKIVACGLCSWELYHFKGELGTYPQEIGHEPAGIIEDVGKDVKNFKVGDRVTGFIGPGFSEYAVADPENLIKIPEGVKTEYALGEPLACISNVCRAANPEFGDYLMIVGAGFMGLLALAGLSCVSLAEMIVVDVKEFNLKLAKDLGATVILNPQKDNIEKEISRITGERGIDISIEATGIPAGVETASKYLRRGRPKLLLVTSHPEKATYSLKLWGSKGTIVLNPHPSFSLDIKDDLRRAIIGLGKGVFPMEKLITHRFALDNIQEAFETLKTKPEGYIKGIICPW
jgi:threonine dehydrogenase-like Zn-dependent dehydrogenase